MTRIAPVGLLLAALSACATTTNGGDDAGTGSAGAGTGGAGTGSAIGPRAGTWMDGPWTVISNTCKDSPQGGGDTYTIDHVTATSFRFTVNNATAAFTCTASGAQYSCSFPDAVTDVRPKVDAVLTFHQSSTATFTDSSHGSVTADAGIDCSGTQCSMFDSLLCSLTVEFSIQAQ